MDQKLNWKRNLYISWLGCFLTGVSFNLVMPFMSLYIADLGITDHTELNIWSGIAVSATALTSALVSPFWGRLADKKGRRLMLLRASLGMTITMGCLGLVQNVYQLVILRMLNGLLSGYIPNATALVASQVPQNKSGWALGFLSTGTITGTLIGPLIGGILADSFGYRPVFFITGFVLLLTFLLTLFFLKEDFKPIIREKAFTTRQLFARLPAKNLILGLFLTTFIIQIANTSISPILPLYIRELLGSDTNISLISGIIISAPGISALIASPYLGRLGDKIGNHKVLIGGLIAAAILMLPMAWVRSPFELGLLRFLLGFTTGALMPSINTLINKNSPRDSLSSIFSYNQSSQSLGNVAGPLIGSSASAAFGYPIVFYMTSAFLLFNLLFTRSIFKKHIH
ncbi:major facilitator family transporter [Listeria floridensis FSL S10-1187]|uniref:Major facilitator family transporter n=1 Tax=Listeria floridensis FSL S10-1187 TaxID=1265817 RepID=A0ABN0REF1_9LIST|nr:multidrug efflux MFS transporter [Listeria floridensis]EUJ30979.1 major facilitator family transporter [Listeria floridensis FSL S10-1187]